MLLAVVLVLLGLFFLFFCPIVTPFLTLFAASWCIWTGAILSDLAIHSRYVVGMEDAGNLEFALAAIIVGAVMACITTTIIVVSIQVMVHILFPFLFPVAY